MSHRLQHFKAVSRYLFQIVFFSPFLFFPFPSPLFLIFFPVSRSESAVSSPAGSGAEPTQPIRIRRILVHSKHRGRVYVGCNYRSISVEQHLKIDTGYVIFLKFYFFADLKTLTYGLESIV